jgi:phage-related protein
MNEELRIIIKAVTDEAKKNLQGVRDELNKIEQEATKSGSVVDKALSGIKKGALAAVGAIVAVTTALVTLGKRSLEFQKIQARLIAGFQSVGLSAATAGKVYKDLFGFLGEADRAGETANLLAQLTQDEKALTEWTNILMGAYSKFGPALPTETLAEAVNHTAHLGKVQGTLADAIEWVGITVEQVDANLANLNTAAEREVYLRNLLNGIYSNSAKLYAQNNQSLISYHKSQVALDQALASATQYVIPLMTALNYLTATLLTALKPAFEIVASVIIVFTQWIIAAIKAVGSFFGIFKTKADDAKKSVQQTTTATKGLSNNVKNIGGGFANAAKQAEKLKRQMMGFDELNVISPAGAAAGIGDLGAAAGGVNIPEVEIPTVDDIQLPGLDEFEEKVEAVREALKGILILVGSIALGLLAWKIGELINDLVLVNTKVGNLEKRFGKNWANMIDPALNRLDTLKAKLISASGIFLIIAGAIALVKGYTDAWVNGIDWKNFALILGGIAAIIGGIAIAVSPTAAAIALVVGGITALVIGIKDFITNGYSLQNVLMIAAGAIAVVVGAVWAFNSALLANPITWVVVGLVALGAAFVILWNECEGFRNFWLNLWEKAKVAFSQFLNSCRPLFEAIGNAFKEAWELIKVIWGHIVGIFNTAWAMIKAKWDEVKPYYAALWEAIKLIFSVVAAVLGNYFKAAWEAIKIIWNVVVAYFTAIWNSIAKIFSVVRKVLSGDFKGAWEDIKAIVGTWANFFATVWEAIKKVFSTVGSFFKGVFTDVKSVLTKMGTEVGNSVSGAFKSAINWVLEKAINLVNGFIGNINTAIGIINKIPGVNVRTLSYLNVPKLATGGIVGSATLAMIGERGKEAVLPLENNTEWMDRLAERIASRSQSPTKLVLNIDGRELGWITIDNINKITQQTGGLQLRV